MNTHESDIENMMNKKLITNQNNQFYLFISIFSMELGFEDF